MYLDPQHWPRPNISSTVTGTPQEPDYCHRVCHGHLHPLVLQGEQGQEGQLCRLLPGVVKFIHIGRAGDPDPNPLVGSGSGSYCSFSSLNSFNKKSKIGDNLRGVPTSVSGAKLLRPAKVKKAQKLYRF